jgi:hypothetical protein
MYDYLREMINKYANSAVSFFQPAILNEKLYYHKDLEINYKIGELLWGGSIVMPKKFVKKMVYWCDQFNNISADDEKMAAAFSIMGIKSFSPYKNFARHYGAYLDSTVQSNIVMTKNVLKQRANLRSGRARDFAQGYLNDCKSDYLIF